MISQLNAMIDGTRTTTSGYDFASGSLTSMSNGTDTTTYTWTGANRLASISSSSTSATFAYDAEGKRMSKTINGVTTQFVYDDIKLIAEKNASGTITAQYFYDDAGKPISMKKNGQNYYFHLDHRGDVMKITDAGQSVVASYSYDPWGNILNSSETTSNLQPFRYASYYWDKEIGCVFRPIPASDFGLIRPPISEQSGHPFRLIPATFLASPKWVAGMPK